MHSLSWAFFGLAAAVLAALMMLMQERMKVEGFALAFWCKVACVAATLPFVVVYGLPSDWRFYAWLSVQALMFAVSDVVMFRHLPDVGAGVVSRILPSTVILGFFLWFAVEPSDISRYAAQPVISALIVLVLGGAAFFAMRLKKCAVTMRAVKLLGVVIFTNTLGPILAKITTAYAPPVQGAFSFTFAEALMMMAMWAVWLAVARPVSFASMVAPQVWRRGMMIGVVSAAMVCVYVASYYAVDNPGYVSALQLVYAVIIMGAHRRMGKKDDSDAKSGLGIVACAALLILLKTRMG